MEGIAEIHSGGQRLETVENFKYLGSKININGKIHKAITERIKGSSEFYNWVCDILRNWNITREIKRLMHKTHCLPILAYGSGWWT